VNILAITIFAVMPLSIGMVGSAYAQSTSPLSNPAGAAIIFVIGLVVSTIIIYVASKLFGQEEGIGKAFLAAIIGTIVYYFIFGTGWIAAIIGGFVWLLALRGIYDIGWLRALGIAVIVWIAATVVGFFIPTAVGPL